MTIHGKRVKGKKEESYTGSVLLSGNRIIAIGCNSAVPSFCLSWQLWRAGDHPIYSDSQLFHYIFSARRLFPKHPPNKSVMMKTFLERVSFHWTITTKLHLNEAITLCITIMHDCA